MTIVEAWLVMDQAALNVLWGQARTGTPPENLKLLTNGVRGFWRDVTPDEVVNIIGTEQEINDFITLIGADFRSIDMWNQKGGFDFIGSAGEFNTDPSRILSLMPDHGPGSPPTFENPNWAHVFLGADTASKIFAGSFTDEFSQEFK